MQEMKQRYDTVNNKLWSLETRIDTMSKDQAENPCVIQSKLDALLRNSIAQEKLATDRTQGNIFDFVESQRNKRESTPLSRGAVSIGPGGPRHNEEWNLEYGKWSRGFHNLSERGGGKSKKTLKKPKEFKDDPDGCIDTWLEVMRLHLEQDNLKNERQACTAILSHLEEGTALKYVVAKKEEERDTADKIFEILFNRFGSGIKDHQGMLRFEKRRQRDDKTIDRFLDDLESLRRGVILKNQQTEETSASPRSLSMG